MNGKTVVRELREASSLIRKSYDHEKWPELLTELERVAGIGEQISRRELALQAQRLYELIDRRMDSVAPPSFSDVQGDVDALIGQIGHSVWVSGFVGNI